MRMADQASVIVPTKSSSNVGCGEERTASFAGIRHVSRQMRFATLSTSYGRFVAMAGTMINTADHQRPLRKPLTDSAVLSAQPGGIPSVTLDSGGVGLCPRMLPERGQSPVFNRACVGLMPKRSLNFRLKCEALLNPQEKAISVTCLCAERGSSSSRRQRSRRWSQT